MSCFNITNLLPDDLAVPGDGEPAEVHHHLSLLGVPQLNPAALVSERSVHYREFRGTKNKQFEEGFVKVVSGLGIDISLIYPSKEGSLSYQY